MYRPRATWTSSFYTIIIVLSGVSSAMEGAPHEPSTKVEREETRATRCWNSLLWADGLRSVEQRECMDNIGTRYSSFSEEICISKEQKMRCTCEEGIVCGKLCRVCSGDATKIAFGCRVAQTSLFCLEINIIVTNVWSCWFLALSLFYRISLSSTTPTINRQGHLEAGTSKPNQAAFKFLPVKHNSALPSRHQGLLRPRPYDLEGRKLNSGISQEVQGLFNSPLHSDLVSRCLKGEKCSNNPPGRHISLENKPETKMSNLRLNESGISASHLWNKTEQSTSLRTEPAENRNPVNSSSELTNNRKSINGFSFLSDKTGSPIKNTSNDPVAMTTRMKSGSLRINSPGINSGERRRVESPVVEISNAAGEGYGRRSSTVTKIIDDNNLKDAIFEIPISIHDVNPIEDNRTDTKAPLLSVPTTVLSRTPNNNLKAEIPINIPLQIFKKHSSITPLVPEVLENGDFLQDRSQQNFSQFSPVVINLQPVTHNHYYSSKQATEYNQNGHDLSQDELNVNRFKKNSLDVPYNGFDLSSIDSQISRRNKSISSERICDDPSTANGFDACNGRDSIEKLESTVLEEEKIIRNSTGKRELYRGEMNENELNVRSEVVSTLYPDQPGSLSIPTGSDVPKYANVPIGNSSDSNIYLFVGGQWFVNFEHQPEVFQEDVKLQDGNVPHLESKQSIIAPPSTQFQVHPTNPFNAVNSGPIGAYQSEYPYNIDSYYGNYYRPSPISYLKSPEINNRSRTYARLPPCTRSTVDNVPPQQSGRNSNQAYFYPQNYGPFYPANSMNYDGPILSQTAAIKENEPISNPELNYEDSLVNVPKRNYDTSFMLDDGSKEQQVAPEIYKPYDVDLSDIMFLGWQFFTALRNQQTRLDQPPSGRTAPALDQDNRSKLLKTNRYLGEDQMANWQSPQQFAPEPEIPNYSNIAFSDRQYEKQYGTLGNIQTNMEQLVPLNPSSMDQVPNWKPSSPYWPSHVSGEYEFINGQFVLTQRRPKHGDLNEEDNLNYRSATTKETQI